MSAVKSLEPHGQILCRNWVSLGCGLTSVYPRSGSGAFTSGGGIAETRPDNRTKG